MLLIFDFSCQIAGLYFLYDGYFNPYTVSVECNQDGPSNLLITLVQMVVIWSLLTSFLFLTIAFATIVFSGTWSSERRRMNMKHYLALWRRRIEWMCSGNHGKRHDGQKAVLEIAREFADFFKDVDWAPSDILVGLVLLKREQKLIREALEAELAMSTNGIKPQPQMSVFSPSLRLEGERRFMMSRRISFTTARANYYRHVAATIAGQANLEHNSEMPSTDSKHEHVHPKVSFINHIEPHKQASQENAIETTRAETAHYPPRSEMPGSQDVIVPIPESPKMLNEACNTSQISVESYPHRTAQRIGKGMPTNLKIRTESSFNPSLYSASIRTSAETARSYSFDNYKRTSILAQSSSRTISFSTIFRTKDYFHSHWQKPEVITRDQVLDILHFAYYAELAYIDFNPSQTKAIDFLIHFSLKNDLYVSPYLVSFDHEWKAIVISIRGTNSTADILVDLSYSLEQLEPIDDAESGRVMFVHSGMLKAARNVVKEILKDKLLSEHLLDPKSPYASYGIVVCGHSLGAGVAAFVAYLLRREGFINTLCYAYEPSGSLLCEEAVPLFEEFCISVVTGDDIVSRLSRHTMDTFKSDVSRLIGACRQSKQQVFGSVMTNLCCRGPSEKSKAVMERLKKIVHRKPVNEPPLYPIKKIREDAQNVTDGINLMEAGKLPVEEDTHYAYPPMYMPGRILYFEKLRGLSMKHSMDHVTPKSPQNTATTQTPKYRSRNAKLRGLAHASIMSIRKIIQPDHKEDNTRDRKKSYKYIYLPRWADKNEFQYIVVSKTMLSDHTPFGILKELDEFGSPDSPLRFVL